MARAAEWAKRVAAWRASGLTAEGFCEGKGYSVKSLWYWSSHLGRASRGPDRTGHEAVQLARVVRPALAVSATDHGGIVVELAGARVEVRGRVDPAALRAVVDALRHESSGRLR